MTIDEFLKKDKELLDKRNRLEAAFVLNNKARGALSKTLNEESKASLWKQLKGKALKGTGGELLIFKKIRGRKGNYIVEFIRTYPGEITSKQEKGLSFVLSEVALEKYELVDAPVTCPVIENYIKERKAGDRELGILGEKQQELTNKIQNLRQELHKGKKKDYLGFLKNYKIVLDKGTYTFKGMYRTNYSKYRSWMVSCRYEQKGLMPSEFSMRLDRYLDICCLEGSRLEPV